MTISFSIIKAGERHFGEDSWYTCLIHLERGIKKGLSENTNGKEPCPVVKKLEIVGELFHAEDGLVRLKSTTDFDIKWADFKTRNQKYFTKKQFEALRLKIRKRVVRPKEMNESMPYFDNNHCEVEGF